MSLIYKKRYEMFQNRGKFPEKKLPTSEEFTVQNNLKYGDNQSFNQNMLTSDWSAGKKAYDNQEITHDTRNWYEKRADDNVAWGNGPSPIATTVSVYNPLVGGIINFLNSAGTHGTKLAGDFSKVVTGGGVTTSSRENLNSAVAKNTKDTRIRAGKNIATEVALAYTGDKAIRLAGKAGVAMRGALSTKVPTNLADKVVKSAIHTDKLKLRASGTPVQHGTPTSTTPITRAAAVENGYGNTTTINTLGILQGKSKLLKQVNKDGNIKVNNVFDFLKSPKNNVGAADRSVLEKALKTVDSKGGAVNMATLKSEVDNFIPKLNKTEITKDVMLGKDMKMLNEYGYNEIGYGGTGARTFIFDNVDKLGHGSYSHFPTAPVGHTRFMDVDGVRHIVENQSDYFQAKLLNPIQGKIMERNGLLKAINRSAPDELAVSKQRLKDFDALTDEQYMSRLTEKELLRKNHQERLLQENMSVAADEGVNTMRLPTAETANKIQGWDKSVPTYPKSTIPTRPTSSAAPAPAHNRDFYNLVDHPEYAETYAKYNKYYDELEGIVKQKSELSANLRNKYVEKYGLSKDQLKEIDNLETLDPHLGDEFIKAKEGLQHKFKTTKDALEESGVTDELMDAFIPSYGWKTHYKTINHKSPNINKFKFKKPTVAAPPSTYQNILKKYTGMEKIIKNLTGKKHTLVTDMNGHTWYEFGLPSEYINKSATIKSYSTGGVLYKDSHNKGLLYKK